MIRSGTGWAPMGMMASTRATRWASSSSGRATSVGLVSTGPRRSRMARASGSIGHVTNVRAAATTGETTRRHTGLSSARTFPTVAAGLTGRVDSGAMDGGPRPPCRAPAPAAPSSLAEVTMKQYGMTILRVVVGAVFVPQASPALFASTPRGIAAFLAKIGLPAPTLLAVLLIVVHGFGGGMLIVGLWPRVAAAFNAGVLLVGFLAVYVREGTILKGGLV